MTCDNPSDKSYRAGCRCEGCRAAHTASVHMRALRKARGESRYVDAGPVRERLLALYAAGYTQRELDRMGISRITQQNVVNVNYRTGMRSKAVSRSTAEKVFSVSGRRLARGTRVPAKPARALLTRWAGLGITTGMVSAATGVSAETLRGIARGRSRQVNASTLVSLLKHKAEIDDMAVFRR